MRRGGFVRVPARPAAPALLAFSSFLGLVVGAPFAHAGGGWVPERGHSYVETSILYLSTDARYDQDGDRTPFTRLTGVARATTYSDAGIYAFGEFGLGKGFGIEGDISWRRLHSTEPATRFATWGPGDLRVLVKRGFRAGSLAWAVSLEGKVPLGYDETEYPSLGSGHADFAGFVHAGYGTSAFYAQAEIGARGRGGPPRDEWPFAAQAGWNFAPRWQLIGDVRGNGLFGSEPIAAPPAGVSGTTTAETVFDPQTASSSIVMAGPGLAFAPSTGARISVQAWRSLAGTNTPEGWKWKLAFARVR
ncbi:MAG: hypothetical protein ACREOU_06835 [Candidatus Eiseniibacteriota bacterium]